MKVYDSPIHLKSKTGEEYRLTVSRDEFPTSPRDDENLSKILCWHPRQYLGDKNEFDSYADFIDVLGEYDKNEIAIFPIRAYEHSGISISILNSYPFNDKWDSYQIGVCIVCKSDIADLLDSEDERKWEEVAKEVAFTEVELYNQFLNGEVFCFTLEKREEIFVECPCCNTKIPTGYDWVEIESCGGFFGDDIEENGMLDYVSGYCCTPLCFEEEE